MKKVVFILLLLLSTKVSAATIKLSCPPDAKVGAKIECRVTTSSLDDINETSFKVEGDFTPTFNPTWTHVESGGVHTFTKDSSTSTTITTIGITFKNVGNKQVNLVDVPGQGTLTSNVNVTAAVKSDNANLKSLTINGKSVKGFSKDKVEYKETVNTNKVTIEAMSEDSNAQVNIPGAGELNLSLGEQTFNIIVTSESGIEKSYKLIITYEAPKDTDNSLKSLELYNGSNKIKELEYKNGINTYEGIKVKTDVSKLTIKATLNNNKSKFVENYGPREIELDYGENILEVRVESESGQVATYTIKVNREDGRSADTTLAKLVVNGNEVELKEKVFEYQVNVRYNETKSRIDATPNNKSSQVDYSDIDLTSGLNEPIKITVTSENKKSQVYTVKIFRLSEEESKITLEKVEVVNYDINFSKYTEEYTINLREGDDKLKFVVLPNEGIKVNELNNENLKNKSTVILRVTDDEKTWTYHFNIVKPEKEMNNTLCYVIFFAGVVIAAASVTFTVLRRKKRSKEIKEQQEKVQEEMSKTEILGRTEVLSDDDSVVLIKKNKEVK